MKIIYIFLPVSLFIPLAWSGCPFQNPFWFLDTPTVVTVVDSDGNMVADRVRVSWGRVENFKCVDYFQIEYFEPNDKPGTFGVSERIARHNNSFDIDVKPCRDYLFIVVASEDWKGMRVDYRQGSSAVSFRVDYAPKFINPPVVIEKRVRQSKPGSGWNGRRKREEEREKRNLYRPFKWKKPTTTTTTTTTTTEPPYQLWVSWRQSDIDWPTCLDYFEFDYYDNVYNESIWKKTLKGPFDKKMEFEVINIQVPCDEDFTFITRVYGMTGEFQNDVWTPPSCIITTPEPTTTTPIPPTPLYAEAELASALEENIALKEKISGLKQHYGPIGQRVYDAVKDAAFHTFESYMARETVLQGGDIGMVQKLAEHASDQDYALDNLI